MNSEETSVGHHYGTQDDYGVCNEHSDSDLIQHDVLLLSMLREILA